MGFNQSRQGDLSAYKLHSLSSRGQHSAVAKDMSILSHQKQLSVVLTELWEKIFPQIEDAYTIPKITERIKYWTGGQIELTQIICQYVVQYVTKQTSLLDEAHASDLVDQIVQKEILSDWKSSRAAFHLSSISDQIAGAENKDLLLLCYLKILQRGAIASDQSPEQTTLIQSGLLAEKNLAIKIANPLYAQIFDLVWIEQQLPGITRPVTIISTNEAPTKHLSTAARLYVNLTVFACGIAIIATAISMYKRQPVSEALAIPESAVTVTPTASNRSSGELSSESPIESSGELATTLIDRALFDRGIDHATNSRWLPMVREFCQIPSQSTYYMPAKQQLAQWVTLYREEIQVAQITFTQEESGSCDIVTSVLNVSTN